MAKSALIKPVLGKLAMIRKTDEFSSVFSFRKRYATAHLVIHYKPNEQDQPRVGFVVAKKIAKRAIDRNYMRRVLRVLCRQELHLLGGVGSKHVDIVIQVKRPFKKNNFLSLRAEMATLFVKIRRKMMQEKQSDA